jgi:hypothetical protein
MKSKDKKVCIVFDATNWENTETARLLLKNEYPDTDLLDLSSHHNHPSGPRHENYKIFSIRDIRSRPHNGEYGIVAVHLSTPTGSVVLD